jgi:hypothetical protein
LTTDGLKLYLFAVNSAFKGDIDYAVINKLYATTVDESGPARRYSPPQCVGCEKKPR